MLELNLAIRPKHRRFCAQDGETFISQEAISKTQFGRYKVTANLFTATSYNEYLQKLLRTITLRFDRVTSHREMPVPNLQINEARTIAVVDRYIRTRLFGQPFNPFNGSDWKILLSKDAIVTKHIKCIYERLGYPSSRGGFEKAFIMFLNTDGEVERFLKISENMHPFAVIYYMRKMD